MVDRVLLDASDVGFSLGSPEVLVGFGCTGVPKVDFDSIANVQFLFGGLSEGFSHSSYYLFEEVE